MRVKSPSVTEAVAPRLRTAEPGVARRLFSGLFASRFGILVAIPGLVLAMGTAFIVLGQGSLETSINAAMRGKMADLVSETGHAAEALLGGSDALLQRLIAHRLATTGDPARGLGALGDALLAGRDALTRVGLTAPDGSEAFVSRGSATPGQRGPGPLPTWYAPAAAASGPVWIVGEGTTRELVAAQAVRDRNGTVLAVAHVHADPAIIEARVRSLLEGIAMPPPPNALADGMAPPHAGMPAPEADALLCAADGSVIAASAQDAIRQPVLAAIAPRLETLPALVYLPTEIAGTTSLISARRLALPGAPPWYAVIHIRSGSLLAPAFAHLHRSLAVGLVVLGLSCLLGFALANHLARQRRLTNRAQAQAASAEERLRALGSYRLIRKLGEGGMGTVWLAEHEMLARPAAVKLIQVEALATSRASRERICARFAREARVTAALHSRNTVTLYDYGLAADGSFYYAMELLDGLDLERLVQVHGVQPAGRVLSILEQACRSLIEAHGHGMVHRDIKPANLFLCRLGAEVDLIKVLDFGLVSEPESKDGRLSGAGTVQGTPAFMAPEQARALPVDARADLYALGCVGYWLLAGRTVFEATDPVGMMTAHVTDTPRSLPVAVPDDLAALISALLRKDPAQRPKSARAVLATLTAIRCPAEQAWTTADAERWWDANQADPSTDAPSALPPSLLMPARSGMSSGLSGISLDDVEEAAAR